MNFLGLPYSRRRRTQNSIFTYAPIHLAFQFDIRYQFKSHCAPTTVLPEQQQSRHCNNISNLHSALDISSRRSQQNIYIDVRDRRPLLHLEPWAMLYSLPWCYIALTPAISIAICYIVGCYIALAICMCYIAYNMCYIARCYI